MQEERNLREASEKGYKGEVPVLSYLLMFHMTAPLVKSVLDGAKQNKSELADNLAVVQVLLAMGIWHLK